MLVDTGASAIALSREDARKAGIPTSIAMNEVGRGADGSVHGEVHHHRPHRARRESAEQMPVDPQQRRAIAARRAFLQKFAPVEIRGDTMTLR